jgi:REP element-mobilizing transposase RayT
MAYKPVVQLSAAGNIAIHALYGLAKRFPEVKIRNVVIMPDHIHFIIQVVKQTEKPLSSIIGSYMGFCTSEFRRQFPTSPTGPATSSLHPRSRTAQADSFFAKGFHDRIVTTEGQLAKLVAYIASNPLRYLIRRQFPEYFQTAQRISCGENVYNGFGNFLLLKDPNKMAVKVSSKYTPEQLESLKRQWMETARSGGVLISPWISKAEKEIRREALALGGRIISILENGFIERYKPAGYEFKLCAQGRLLQIAATPYSTTTEKLSRATANALNAIAAQLAAETNFFIKR